MSRIDQATSVRKGEELAIENLTRFLQKNLEGFDGVFQVRQFPSGYSNLTYLLTTRSAEYVLRRPPFGADIKTAHDMSREYNVLTLLKPAYPQVPAPLIFCENKSVIGAPFYIMERITGVILRNKPPESIALTSSLMKTISESVIDNLIALHAIDLEKSGLIQLGKPKGYVQRQVDGWVKRYYRAETDKIEAMDLTTAWMKNHIPEDSQAAFIHNDYKYDNLVLNPDNLTEIKAVLDWEMATVGHPLMDLGTSLGYWGEANDNPALKPFSLTWLPGNLTREEVVQRYADKSGRDINNMVFYYVFGSFKIGVIVQQIYARYKKGLTSDPRFKDLIHVVNACADNARNSIEYGRISDFY